MKEKQHGFVCHVHMIFIWYIMVFLRYRFTCFFDRHLSKIDIGSNYSQHVPETPRWP